MRVDTNPGLGFDDITVDTMIVVNTGSHTMYSLVVGLGNMAQIGSESGSNTIELEEARRAVVVEMR